MYRIELSPGEETVFRSIEELAVAIRRGVVTSRARIYHNASGKWLPIQFHPHYKVAVSMPLTQANLVAGPPVKPLSSLKLEEPADPEPPTPAIVAAPAQRIAATPIAEQPVRKKRSRPEQPAGEKRGRRPTKSRRQLRIALVGALLVGGAQWVLSAPLFSRAEDTALALTQRRLFTGPAEAMKRVAAANTAAMVPVIRTAGPGSPATSREVAEAEPADTAQKPVTWGPPVESAAGSEIEPPPSTIDIAVPAAAKVDSLTSKMVDSTNKKAIKRILRAVSGTPAKEKNPAKR
jgi:hypothetical protein